MIWPERGSSASRQVQENKTASIYFVTEEDRSTKSSSTFVVVEAINSTTATRSVSGRLRQFCVM